MLQENNIFKQQKRSSDFLKVVFPMVYGSLNNNSLGLDQILHLLPIRYVNLCMLQENNIFKQQKGSSDFLKVVFPMVYGSLKVLSIFQHTLMLIGLAAHLIGGPPVDIVYFLALISSVGVKRNKALLLVPLQKLNIVL
ncbi:hypothetical protein ACFX13_022966 [Malus domestica]